MLKNVILITVTTISLIGNDLYWYSDNQKIKLYSFGYDSMYKSEVYSNSKNHKSKKMILTNNIIVSFLDTIDLDYFNMIIDKYNLKLVKKMDIGSGFYIFRCLDNNSIQVSNTIYEKESNIKSSYPDWMILK